MAQATAFPATIIAMMIPSIKHRNIDGVRTQEDAIESTKFIKQLKKHIPISIVDHIVHEYEI